jgi:hypothetical protein
MEQGWPGASPQGEPKTRCAVLRHDMTPLEFETCISRLHAEVDVLGEEACPNDDARQRAALAAGRRL